MLQKAIGADISFLQETNEPGAAASVCWSGVPNRTWGSAVILASGRVARHDIDGYEGWVAGGEVLDSEFSADRPLWVYSIHTPTVDKKLVPGSTYAKELQEILTQVFECVPAEADLVLGGDFNLKSLSERLQGESIKTEPAERTIMSQLSARGLESCWTAAHPATALAQTLRWSGDVSKPYHCDGLFVPRAWAERSVCEVLQSPWITSASDHNPVAAWLLA